MDDARLQALVADYHHRSNSVRSEFDTMLRLAGIGYTTAVAVATVISSTNVILPVPAYWLAPLTFALLYALAIQSFHRIVFTSYYLREVEEEIATTADIDFFHFETAQAKALFNVRTGRPSMIATYAVIFVVTAAIYFVLVLFCYQQLAPKSSQYLLGAFLGMNVALGVVMIVAIIPVLKGFRSPYDAWIRGPSLVAQNCLKRSDTLWFALYGLIPRPLDLVLKSINIGGAAAFALILTRESLNTEIATKVLLVFVTVDLLTKQGTYIWNDILDIDADRTHPFKKERGLAKIGKRGLPAAKGMFLARVIVGVILATWLSFEWSSWWLLFVVLVLVLLQFVYDRLAKPLGAGWKLGVCALGYGERWVVGVLAVMSVTGHFDLWVLWGLVVWGTVFSVVFLSGYWWCEAEYFLRRFFNEEAEQRPNPFLNSWFLTHSPRFRRMFGVLLFPISASLCGRFLNLDIIEYSALACAGIATGLVAIIAMDMLRRKRRELQASDELESMLRSVLLLAIAAFVGVSWWIGFRHEAYIASLGIPLFVLVLYDYNPYEDLMLVKLSLALRSLPSVTDQLLFGHWDRGSGRTNLPSTEGVADGSQQRGSASS